MLASLVSITQIVASLSSLFLALLLEDMTCDLALGLPSFRLHDALVEPRVGHLGLLDGQGRHVVLEVDLHSVSLDQLLLVVVELQLGLVSARELDVEPDPVAVVHVHLLQRPGGLGAGTQHIFLPFLHHVQVGAALGGTAQVLQEAGEDPRIIWSGLGDGQRARVVIRHNLEVL